MKTSPTVVLLTAALCAAGCQQASNERTETPSSTSDAVVVVEGVSPAQVHSALLVVAEANVLADGQALESSLEPARADLARQDGKFLLRFSVPADADTIEVRLGFDDFGGYESDAIGAGEIDARGALVSFQASARELRESGRATVRIDLARSLVETPRPGRLAWLPQYDVRY